jgi:hypothetical protein
MLDWILGTQGMKVWTGCIWLWAETDRQSNEQTNKQIPRSRVLQKPRVTWLVKKLPTFYGSQRFITMFTGACHWSLT